MTGRDLERLTRHEVLKLWTLRRARYFAAVGLATTMILGLVGLVLVDEQDLRGAQGASRAMSSAGLATLFALALGILAMAAERRHRTLYLTVLASAGRWPVVVAKAAAAALVGFVLGLLVTGATLGLAKTVMSLRDITLSTGGGAVWQVPIGVPLAAALCAAIGVAVGTIVRNQVAAFAAAFAWLLIVDPIIRAFVPDVGRFLPGGALTAFAHSPVDDMLAQVPGGLLLTGYALAFVAAAAVVLRNRDID